MGLSNRNPLESPEGRRPYMPTPDEYVTTLEEGKARPKVMLPRKRRRIWPQILGLFLFIVMAGVVGYGYIIASNVAKISTQPLDFSTLTGDAAGRTNILVLGIGDPGHAGEKLSDTMMVISLDSHGNKIAQVSLPRDMRVLIPGYGYGKINSANALGGVKLAEQTVSDTLNIPIHYYVQTNFSGLRELVDAVGGVDVDVKERLADPEYPCDDDESKSCGLVIEPGLQHMNGTRALQYARCRKGTCGNDFGRADRQQEIMSLVREKMVKWSVLLNPTKLTPITTALRSGIQTDMGTLQMLQFALDWQSAQKNQPIRLVLNTGTGGYLTGAGGSSDLIPVSGSYAEIQDRVNKIFTTPPQSGDLPQ